MTPSPTTFRSGFVAILGRPNVGKSTLLNRLLGQKIAITSSKPQTTRNRILGVHHFPGGQAVFLDTPGIHRGKGLLNQYMVRQAFAACRGVDLVLLLVEAGDAVGGGDEFILRQIMEGEAPIVLVVNKIDRVAPPQLLPLIRDWSEKFPFAAVVPVSALSGDGVESLLDEVKGRLPEGPHYFPEDAVTDLPERFIVAEMVREQILEQTREEVPHRAAVTVESFEEKPEKGLVVIGAVIHLERETQRKIVLGKGGSRLRSIGQAARREIEELLGCRVYLDLFVRIQKDWTRSARSLAEFGYHD